VWFKPDRPFFLKILVLISIILTTSCNMPTSTPVVDYPYCRYTADLSQPDIAFPIDFQIVDDLTPPFFWSYSGDCQPMDYRIEIVQDYMSHGCGGSVWVDEDRFPVTETITDGYEWSPAAELEPLKMYKWRVTGIIPVGSGEYSEIGCFWSGPRCSADSLVAPDLLGPEDMTVLNDDHLMLSWDYPEECLPEIFQPELVADPTFAGPNLMGTFSETEIRPAYSMGSMPLEDCTQYYWRVTARVGSTWGSSSITRTFSTDIDGTCSGDKDDTEPTASATPYTIPPSVTPTLKPVVIPPTKTPTSPPPKDTTPPPAPAPKAPSGGIVLGCSSQTTVKWGGVSDPSGISEYRVQLGTHSGDNNWHPPAGSPYTGISGTSTSVSVDCGMYYRWRVRAIDGAGNMGPLSAWAYFTVTLE